jgi:hypothetical protein
VLGEKRIGLAVKRALAFVKDLRGVHYGLECRPGLHCSECLWAKAEALVLLYL